VVLHAAALRAYDQIIGLELGDGTMYGCMTKALCGRQCAGASRVDHRKGGQHLHPEEDEGDTVPVTIPLFATSSLPPCQQMPPWTSTGILGSGSNSVYNSLRRPIRPRTPRCPHPTRRLHPHRPVAARVADAIWHNWATGAPGKRNLTPYDNERRLQGIDHLKDASGSPGYFGEHE
jgi:hypothetical protein